MRVSLERALHSTLVKLEGVMDRASARRLAAGIRAHLRNNDADVKVVVAEGTRQAPGPAAPCPGTGLAAPSGFHYNGVGF